MTVVPPRRCLNLLCSLLILLGALPDAGVAAESFLRETVAASITVDAVKQHVNTLADDTFEGREAGSRGGRAAGLYIVKELQAAGVKPGGPQGSFYQPFGSGYSNILGLLEGSDPELKDQVVIVSAHYDHVGYGTARNSYGPIGYIHNGADDNASGVAALLEVIDAFCNLPTPPKRTLLFAFWDGEEKGLLGSEHWVQHPTFPLAQVALVINADMVGRARDNRLEIFGTRTTRGLRRAISSQNDRPGLAIDFSWEVKNNSDHYTFFQRRIPALLVHTGLHKDYHRPSDDIEQINSAGLQQISQLVFRITDDLANAPTLASFRQQGQSESPTSQKTFEQPLSLPHGRLGIRWETKPATPSVIVSSVEPGSAAAGGGLKVGDKIVRFGGFEVTTPENFRAIVWAAESPAKVRVERAGAEEPVDLNLTLPGTPSRLGISWRTDDAEPGILLLNRVLPGSPADMAGVRVGDRLYQIAGRDFESAAEFQALAASLPAPIELLVEKSGQTRVVTLLPVEPIADEADADEADSEKR